jgi:hypothetical protein
MALSPFGRNTVDEYDRCHEHYPNAYKYAVEPNILDNGKAGHHHKGNSGNSREKYCNEQVDNFFHVVASLKI